MNLQILEQDARAMKVPVPTQRHRFHLLDAMRGLAALLVVTYHVPPFFKSYANFPGAFLAVDFFFCLSGFVIAYSYPDRLERELKSRSFFMARLIRLYPLYALGSLLSLLRGLHLSYVFEQVHSRPVFGVLLALAALLIPNVFFPAADKLYPFDYPPWSLFFELVANLCYAGMVRLRIAAKALLAVGLLSLMGLTWIALHRTTLDTGWDAHTLGIGFARVGFSFAAGVLLFGVFRIRSGDRVFGRKARAGAALAVGLLLAALMFRPGSSYASIYQLLEIAFLFPALIYLGANCSLPAGFRFPCAFLGNASYPLYMLHVPLMLPFYDQRSESHFMATHEAFLPCIVPAFVLLLLWLSWVVGKYFDEPGRRAFTVLYQRFERGYQGV